MSQLERMRAHSRRGPLAARVDSGAPPLLSASHQRSRRQLDDAAGSRAGDCRQPGLRRSGPGCRGSRALTATPRLVLTGFSQGVAMMFRDGGRDVAPGRWRRSRSAATCRPRSNRPPWHAFAGRSSVTASRDEWYTAEIFGRDVQRLREAGVDRRPLEFDGGHEWSDEVVQAASRFLRERLAMIEIRTRDDRRRRSAGRAPMGISRARRTAAVETHDAFVRRCASWMRRELQRRQGLEGVGRRPRSRRSSGRCGCTRSRKIPNPVAEREQLRVRVEPLRQAVCARRHRHASARGRARLVPSEPASIASCYGRPSEASRSTCATASRAAATSWS